MSKNLHLEFIDPEQKYALTKIASKDANNQSFPNGLIIKGFAIVGSADQGSYLLVSAFKEAFQTSALLKVEYKHLSIKVNRYLNSNMYDR